MLCPIPVPREEQWKEPVGDASLGVFSPCPPLQASVLFQLHSNLLNSKGLTLNSRIYCSADVSVLLTYRTGCSFLSNSGEKDSCKLGFQGVSEYHKGMVEISDTENGETG